MQPQAQIEAPLAAFIFESEDRWDILHVLGEVDLSNASEMETGMTRLNTNNGARPVLDLTACSYIDSTGLRVIAKAFEASSGRLCVVVPKQSQIYRIFEITGLTKRLQIEDGLDELRSAP